MKYRYIYNSRSSKAKVHLLNRYGNTYCRTEHHPNCGLDRRTTMKPARALCSICTFLEERDVHRKTDG